MTQSNSPPRTSEVSMRFLLRSTYSRCSRETKMTLRRSRLQVWEESTQRRGSEDETDIRSFLEAGKEQQQKSPREEVNMHEKETGREYGGEGGGGDRYLHKANKKSEGKQPGPRKGNHSLTPRNVRFLHPLGKGNVREDHVMRHSRPKEVLENV